VTLRAEEPPATGLDRNLVTLSERATEVVAAGTDAGRGPRFGGRSDLVPLGQLIRQTPGAYPIESIDELRSDAFGTDEELDEFLACVAESRQAGLA
jgi:hypothetical protein